MILETLLSTALTEWLKSKIPKRKIKNDKQAIEVMSKEMPTAETVGELRFVLLFPPGSTC